MVTAHLTDRLDPQLPVEGQARELARARLDDALGRLDRVVEATPAEIEETVHEVRKRCKEVRGLARLVRPGLGREFGRFNRLVRDAAVQLSTIRDAHAVLASFERLRSGADDPDDPRLELVHERHASIAAEATDAIRGGDERIRRARRLLTKARARVSRWEIADDFAPMGEGLTRTYRRGQRGMHRAESEPTDERMHEWRKAVKNLWYQVRLVEAAAPSALAPLEHRLDDLADALGDDHDLAVLIERLEADPARFGGRKAVKRSVRVARYAQEDLRWRAFRLGATIYAEPADAFVGRIRAYWDAARERGPEPATGGIARLSAGSRLATAPGATERERKFLVPDPPPLGDDRTELRQGYVALDGEVSVRIRDDAEAGCTLTVKSGSGPVRTELEWPIDRGEFDAAWKLTEHRRVHKTRHALARDDDLILVDVFHDGLDGLVLAEVEFANDDALAAFQPPEWFGREVTDDARYSNASLAAVGLDPSLYR